MELIFMSEFHILHAPRGLYENYSSAKDISQQSIYNGWLSFDVSSLCGIWFVAYQLFKESKIYLFLKFLLACA